MNPPVNLFGDDSPRPKKKVEGAHFRSNKHSCEATVGTKDNKIGNSRRNKKRVTDVKVGTVTDLQTSLVATNHKLKFKTELQEDETDVVSLVRLIYKDQSVFPTANTIIEEDDDGDTEYKLKLIDTSRERIQQLTTQMKYRIKEGNSEAYYKIGYEDNGNPLGLGQEDMTQSLNSLCHIANDLRVDLVVQKVLRGQQGMVAEVLVREIRESVNSGIKINLMGESGSGKSTLVSL